MRRVTVVVVALLAGCAPPEMPSVSREESPPEQILFRDVSVFDGKRMLRHQDVLVTGDIIEAVATTGSLTSAPGALEIPGAGRTLLPGLVDSHAHLFSAGEKGTRPPSPEAIAQAFLFAGVTTVLVAASFEEATELERESEAGKSMTPHLFHGGPGLTAPGGHPIPLLRAMLPWPLSRLMIRAVPTAADAAEARAATRAIADELEPAFFKIVYDDLPPGSPHLSLDAMTAAVDEAHRAGVRPIVHTTTPEDAVAAAEAGAALLVHVPQRGVLAAESIARLVDTNVALVSTVRLISASHELAERGPSPLERSMFGPGLLQPWLDDPAWDLPGFSEEIDTRWKEVAEDTRENFKLLFEAGVPFFVGTDSGVHGVFPGASLHHEIRTLVELGVPNLEVLTAVTSAPAIFLDPEERFGRIAPGQRADLLLVRGDPSEDILALSEIDDVFLEGVRLQRVGAGEKE